MVRIGDTGGMAKGTPAVAALERAGIEFTLHAYEVPEDARSYGEAAAVALGVEPGRVLKTLVATVDGTPVIGIVPVSGQLSLKRLAAAAGGKRASMADAADAQRLTGYVIGGISPFGRRRRLPVFLDGSASGYDTVFVSAGRRGLQVEVASDDLVALVGAVLVPIAR